MALGNQKSVKSILIALILMSAVITVKADTTSPATERTNSSNTTWSAINASLTYTSTDNNKTAYIEGSIYGDRKRNITLYIGKEKITEKGPLNGTFRIPVDIKKIGDGEIRLRSSIPDSFNAGTSLEEPGENKSTLEKTYPDFRNHSRNAVNTSRKDFSERHILTEMRAKIGQIQDEINSLISSLS